MSALLQVDALTLPISVTSTASTSAALPAAGSYVRIVNEGPNAAVAKRRQKRRRG